LGARYSSSAWWHWRPWLFHYDASQCSEGFKSRMKTVWFEPLFPIVKDTHSQKWNNLQKTFWRASFILQRVDNWQPWTHFSPIPFKPSHQPWKSPFCRTREYQTITPTMIFALIPHSGKQQRTPNRPRKGCPATLPAAFHPSRFLLHRIPYRPCPRYLWL
jgi:hypothetical protein